MTDTKRLRTLPLLAALLLGGCGYNGGMPPEAYRHYGDRLKADLGGLLGTPCVEHGRRVVAPSQCYVWGVSERHHGVLLTYDFRPADFIEGTAQPPKNLWSEDALDAVSDHYRMGFKPGDNSSKIWDGAQTAKAYRITFTGRKTAAYPRQYPSGKILIEHIDSIRRIPWNPEP